MGVYVGLDVSLKRWYGVASPRKEPTSPSGKRTERRNFRVETLMTPNSLNDRRRQFAQPLRDPF